MLQVSVELPPRKHPVLDGLRRAARKLDTRCFLLFFCFFCCNDQTPRSRNGFQNIKQIWSLSWRHDMSVSRRSSMG